MMKEHILRLASLVVIAIILIPLGILNLPPTALLFAAMIAGYSAGVSKPYWKVKPKG